MNKDLSKLEPKTIDGIKRLARQLKKQAEEEGKTPIYGHCLEQAAKQAGFRTYAAARHALPEN